MLIILNDPAGITGRKSVELDYSLTIQQNIARHLASGFECSLRINGEDVDPLTDERLSRVPDADDVIAVIRRPASAFTSAFAFVVNPFIALNAAVAQGALNALVPNPSLPANVATGVTNTSPNNSLTSQTNVARAYQAIPDVYGYRRVWPDLIQPSTVEYIDHIKYVTEWLCVSRGRGSITDVQYADTPIDDISGASYEVFAPTAASGYPEQSGTTINDVLETFASDEVNGQEMDGPAEIPSFTRVGSFSASSGATTFTVSMPDGIALAGLKYVSPSGTAAVSFTSGAVTFSQTCGVLSYTVSGGVATFTLSSTSWASAASGSGVTFTIDPVGPMPSFVGPFTLPIECDRIHWNTVFPRGLKGSAVIKTEWWKVDSAGNEIPGTRQTQTDTYSADTYDERFYTTKVTPSAGRGRYRIQFYRTNAAASDGSTLAKLEEVYAVRYYATKSLPGVTIIRVTTKATTSATGFSDRKFNLRWHRHVRTLTSDALSPSRNFARSMAHVWTLAGNSMSGLDVDRLQAINDEFGEDSPLLRFDGSIDDANISLGERLQMLANHARCTVWRDGTKWTVTRDQAKPYPEMQLDYRNLSSGGDSSITYAAHLPASNDGVEVEYVNEQTQATKSYVRLSIETGAVVETSSPNPKKIRLQGCTNIEQANNRAQLEARRLLYQRTSVSDTALSDAGALGLGSLVRWVDPNDFGTDELLQAGEVTHLDGDVIQTSEELDWGAATTGRILLTGEDGLYLSAPIICTRVDGGVQLSSVPSGLYVADTDRQCGSRYAFAVGVTSAEMQSAGLYTVTEIKPESQGTVSVGLVNYDARMFEAD